MTDKVSDLIIRIKNAYLAQKDVVQAPATKLSERIATLLVEKGYLSAVERVAKEPQDILVMKLRYVNNQPAMTNVKRISKPGQRIYTNADKLPRVLSGYGTTIVTTSKGVLTDDQARKENVGGEVLFMVW